MAETYSFVEKTLKKREEIGKAIKEKERRKKEERARKEQRARERRDREARQTERSNDREEVSNPTSGGGETPKQTSAGAEDRQWLCEHYKRL